MNAVAALADRKWMYPLWDLGQRLVNVTPPMAIEWMMRNKGNRRFDPFTCRVYTDDMVAGRWRLTHQGLAFDVDGNLIDGQHRLQAVIDSGVTIQFYVTCGLPREIVGHIDAQKVRTPSDVSMILYGENVDAWKLSIAIWMNYRFDATSDRDFRVSTQKKLALLREHSEAIRFGVQFHGGRGAGLTSVATTVIARAYYHEDPVRLREFAEIANCGITTHQGCPAAALFSYLTKSRHVTNSFNGRAGIYARTEQMLRLFLDGKTTGKITPAKSEYWPLPAGMTKTSSATDRPQMKVV